MKIRWTRLRRTLSALTPSAQESPEPTSHADISRMIGAIGPALLRSSQATNEVDETLRLLASQYGRPDLRVVSLPTFVLVEEPGRPGDPDSRHTSVFPAEGEPLRLDQAGAIEHLIHRAAREQLDPQLMVSEVEKIVSDEPRFGFWASLFGHALLTVGFGLVMNPTAAALPIYALLGLVIGLIVLLGSRVRTLSLVLPVIAAFVATVITSAFAGIVQENVLLLVAPALVSLLPGLMLTIAAVELTNGQIIAGASRLVYGFARLGLLAFGVYVGIVAAHATLSTGTTHDRLGAWAPWVGILLVGLGYYLYSAAPRGSLLWIIFALAVAQAAQMLGHVLLGTGLSGLIGAVIAVPVIYLVSHVASAPPPAVMLTCAYWLLVPGALGFISLSEVASGSSDATSTLLQTIGSVFAIAIGMVVGTGLSRDTAAFAHAWNRHTPAPEA